MNKTNKDSSGTSFHSTTIECSIAQLRTIIGNPQYEVDCIDDKVNFEWVCETNECNVVTVYDWKEYRPLSETETITFHIGGFTQWDTELAKDELLLLIGNCVLE